MTEDWITRHRSERGTERLNHEAPLYQVSRDGEAKLYVDKGFNNHEVNDGKHVSPYDNGQVFIGPAGIEVRLTQGINEESLRRVLSRATRATTGIAMDEPDDPADVDEMFRGGLQAALESQVLVFEVWNVSRTCTHQLVRTRKAGFHQQSQRATWFGDEPDARWPQSIFDNKDARPGRSVVERYPATLGAKWERAQTAAWEAYRAACDAGISYQDARFILPEGTVNYIQCEYTIREFINVFAYRGCSMFAWEIVTVMRLMREALLAAHPFMEPYVKISCEKGGLCGSCGGNGKFSYDNPTLNGAEWVDGIAEDSDCPMCGGLGGARKCTFQGWESVEGVCDFPWAKQDNRVFLPSPKYRIGA